MSLILLVLGPGSWPLTSASRALEFLLTDRAERDETPRVWCPATDIKALF
jgi:hypothetical protein